jgi:hypothetical protein
MRNTAQRYNLMLSAYRVSASTSESVTVLFQAIQKIEPSAAVSYPIAKRASGFPEKPIFEFSRHFSEFATAGMAPAMCERSTTPRPNELELRSDPCQCIATQGLKDLRCINLDAVSA